MGRWGFPATLFQWRTQRTGGNPGRLLGQSQQASWRRRGLPELNLKGKFGSPRGPRGEGLSVPGMELPELQKGRQASVVSTLCAGWVVLDRAAGRGWGSCASLFPPASVTLSLSRPCHKCFLSLALSGLGSQGRNKPLILCEAVTAEIATLLTEEETEAQSREAIS